MLFTKATTVIANFGTHGGAERSADITTEHKRCAWPLQNHVFRILLYEITRSSRMFRPCQLVNSWKRFGVLLCTHLQVRALQEELLLFDCLNLKIKAKGLFKASGAIQFQIRPKISQASPVISVNSGGRLVLSSVKWSIVFPLQSCGLSF